MAAALDTIAAELGEADRQERIELLIDFSKNLPPLPDRLAAHKDAAPSGRGMPVAGVPFC